MYAMNTSELLSTLAVFSEMIDIIEWIEVLLHRKSYLNQSEDSNSKRDSSEAWTSELTDVQQGQTKQNETSSASVKNAPVVDDVLTKEDSSPYSLLKMTSESQVNVTTPLYTADTAIPSETVDEYLIIQQESTSDLPSNITTIKENEIVTNEIQDTEENNRLKVDDNFDQKDCAEVNSENQVKNSCFDTRKSCEISYNSSTSENLEHPSPVVTEDLLLSVKLSSISKENRTENSTTSCSSAEIKLTNENSYNFYQNNRSNVEHIKEMDDSEEIHGIKKFTTSSWNLEAVMESLYKLTESPESSKMIPGESLSKRVVRILSQGSFCSYPEDEYEVILGESLHITQVSEPTNLLSLLIQYGEVSIIDTTTLKLDNKLGRCLYFKCDTHTELQQLKKDLEVHIMRHWESESINLVHYPLKCHQNVVIIDLGSFSTRAGILMDEPTLPFVFFPSVCATDKITGHQVFGIEALQSEVRQNSILSFPVRPSIKIVKHSIDIDLVGGLFKKIFSDLRIDPTQYTIQVCLPRSLSISARNSLVKLLLEELNVRSVSLTHQALLTLYAHNVSTGIVVDIGDRMDILPVVDGFIVETGVTRLPCGGQRLIHHMKHALAEKHISLSNDIDAFVVQYIAENLSYVAENYEEELHKATQYPDMIRKSITLQTFAKDDKCVHYATLDDARFQIPEGLFQPELWGLDSPGVHKLVQKAIHATSVDVRKRIAENIYVSGGVTLIPGFVERLFKEVEQLNKPRIHPKVIASNYRYHCTYIGACKFAKMEVFPKVCVNMEEYSKNQLSSLKKFALYF